MPLSKNIASYPANFFDLARAIRGITQPLVITMETQAEATRFRQQIYGFAGALAASNNSEYHLLADAIRSVEIRRNGPILTLISRLDTAAYKAVNQILAQIAPQLQSSDTLHSAAAALPPEIQKNDQAMIDLGYSPRLPAQPDPRNAVAKPTSIDITPGSGSGPLEVVHLPSDGTPEEITDAAKDMSDVYLKFMGRKSNDPEG